MTRHRAALIVFGWVGAFHATASTAETPLVVLATRSLYPPAAIAAHLQGRVELDLSITPTGALSCSVAPGGTLAVLKRESCLLVARRDIFAPNTDRTGVAVATRLHVAVWWSLTEPDGDYGGAVAISPYNWVTSHDYPLSTVLMGTTTAQFRIGEFGRISECRTIKSSGHLFLDAALCPLLEERALFLPALDAEGNKRSSTATYSYEWPFGRDKLPAAATAPRAHG